MSIESSLALRSDSDASLSKDSFTLTLVMKFVFSLFLGVALSYYSSSESSSNLYDFIWLDSL